MDFSIKSVARDYVNRRFPRASSPEKEKIILDWTNKIEISKNIVEDFTKRVGPLAGKKVLDVGCGNGGMSISLALSGAKPVGLEVEEELYEISKKQAEAYGVDIGAILYDGEKMPFDDDFFELAISVSVLEHTSDPILYLREILRVIKPGGLFYLAFPNKIWPKETHTGLWFLTYLPRLIRPKIIKLFHRNSLEDYNLHFYSYRDLEKMLAVVMNGGYHWQIVKEPGESSHLIKILIKKILGLFGVSYKIFLPHISVILKKCS